MSIPEDWAKEGVHLDERARRLAYGWTASDGLDEYYLTKLKGGLREKRFVTLESRDCLGEVSVLLEMHVTLGLAMQ